MSTYKLYQGDCLKVIKNIEDGSVDLVVTDPPYLKAYSTILNDREFDLDKLFNEFKRILKPDGHLYIFGCWQTGDKFKQELEKYFKIKNKLIWVKNNWSAGDLFWTYGQSYEEIWYATNGRKKLNGKRDRDCLFYNRVAGKKQLHTNQKPVELLEFIIEKSSNEQDVVFDPFMGSGSTGVACLNTNRNFIGIELDEGYFEIALNRIKQDVIDKGMIIQNYESGYLGERKEEE